MLGTQKSQVCVSELQDKFVQGKMSE